MSKQQSLTYNIKHFQHGTQPIADPIEDMNIKRSIPGNSWFWVTTNA